MKAPALPQDEVRRLEVLRQYDLLDTPAEQALDDLASLASHICGVPIALVSLVDSHRQWFKAKLGVNVSETPREISFCGHAILGSDLFIVPDATQDERFRDNPLVTGEQQVRFYAGAPLVTRSGHALGALCVMDRAPRQPTGVQLDALRMLARQVMSQLELRRQSRELLESETRLHVVTENARVGLFMVNQERRYVYANRAYSELVSRTQSELVGRRMLDVLPDIYEQAIRPGMDRAFAGERVAFETSRQWPEGMRYYSAIYEPRRTESGIPLVVGVVTDVTERRLAEMASEERRAELQLILDTVPALVFYKDCESRFVRVNSSLAQLAGVSPEHFIGKTDADMGSPYGERHRRDDLAVMNSGKPLLNLEEEIHIPSGSRWFITDKIPHRDQQGRISGIIGFSVDITARKQTEAALQRSQADLLLALESARLGRWDWNIVTGEVRWSPECLALYGRSPDDKLDYPSFLASIHPEDRSRVDAALRIAVEEKGRYDEVKRVILPDGSQRWTASRGQVYCDQEGKPLRMTGVTFDITERKQNEAALDEAARFAQATIDALSAHICVLDENGTILATNRAWQRFAESNDLRLPASRGTLNYLQVCDATSGPEAGDAARFAEGIRAVIKGAQADFTMEYPCHRPGEERWFVGRVTRFCGEGPLRIVVAHENITKRKKAENALRIQQAHAQSLLQLSRALERVDSHEEILRAARETVENVLGFRRMWLYQLTEDGKHLKLVAKDAAAQLADGSREATLLQIEGDAMLEEIASARDIVIVEDAVTDPRTNKKIVAHLGSRTIVNVPVILAGKMLAIIGTGTFAEEGVRRMTEAEQEFLSALASHIAAVFDRVSSSRARLSAEADLRAGEERLRTVTNTAQVGLVIVDGEHRYRYANPSYARILGLKSHEIIGQRIADVLPSVYPEQIRPRLELAFRGERVSYELQVPSPDGSAPRYYVVTYEPSPDQIQPLVVVVIVDITERKRGEETARQSQTALLKAQSIAKLGNWEWNTVTQAVVWSPEMFDIFGHAPEHGPVGSPEVSQCFTPESWQRLDANVQAAVAGGTSYECDVEVIRPDGTHRWVTSRGEVFSDAQGAIAGLRGTVQDITGRKQTELALRESEERFRQLAENIDEVFWITDPSKGRILYISPAYEKIWGRSCASLYAAPVTWLDAIHPDDRQRVREAATTRQVSGEYDEIYRILRPDASIRWIHDRAFPVFSSSGDTTRIVGVANDITNHRQLEEQFRQAQKMEAIGQLAGGVAHDFNNILAAIMMQVELLDMTESLSADAQNGLHEIKASAERAANLTRQLLLFSRKQVMHSRNLDLNEVVTSISKMLSRIIGEDISLQLNLYPRQLAVHADSGMIDQVLMNLVVNARDAMPSGGRISVTLSEKMLTAEAASSIPDARAGRYACVRVSDTGSGIPPEILSRIFEPFFTTKAAGKGTGLGLATVFGIVKQHGGAVTVESEVGCGTTFQIFLPLIDAAELTADRTAKIKPRGGTETILLVEDDDSLRSLSRKVLERAGYTVLEAPDGVVAEQVWDENRASIRLLLTDIVMPEGVSGRDLAARLQAQTPGLKVVFTSGYSAELAGRELALEEGQNFIQKPAAPPKLLEVVRRSLDS